jgi:hypothetical protein
MATKKGGVYLGASGRMTQDYDLNKVEAIHPNKWRASGKCKTWKTRPNEFKLPIKYGLYESGYLTHENAHLFEVAK